TRADAATQTMKCKSSSRLTCTVKVRNHFSKHVNNLTFLVHSKTRITIVEHWRRPGGIKGRRLNLILRSRLTKVGVFSLIHEGVVLGDCLFQHLRRHWNFLMLILAQAARKFPNRIASKEVVVCDVNKWWLEIPLLAFRSLDVEDCPNRAGD